MLNQRQRSLLATLIQQARFVPVARLAEEYGVSPRTIRLDLEAIDGFLRPTPYQLERHKLHGARVIIPPAERPAWLERLGPAVDAAFRLSPEERRLAILSALLRRSTPLSLGRLADELYVSRRTVGEDLKHVEAWLAARRLELLRLPAGLVVRGSEAACRRALADLLAPAPSALPPRRIHALLRPLPPEEMAQIEQVVTSAAEGLPFQLADVAIAGLVCHLGVAVMRLRSGHDIVMERERRAELAGRPEWRVAERIARGLEQRLGVPAPEDELGFITLHLLAAKTIGQREGGHVTDADAWVADAVSAFVRAASAHLGVDLTTDAELHRGLVLHLRAAVYRLRFDLRLVNPLREEIEAHYGYLIDAAQEAAADLERALGVRITPDELAYLAMHIGASLERKTASAAPKALLVCGSGIGTARLLESRMLHSFPGVQILGVVPLARAHQAEVAAQADVIISTVPLALGSKPVVVVNPFLTPEDVRQIRQALAADRVAKSSSAERMRGPMLQEVLTEDLIRLEAEAGDWEQAIRLAGEPLVEAGHVEPRFVEAMVETVRRIGPYIVLDPGVAMPHARPEDGVRRIGFSFVRLRRPVRFGHAANDPVRLVFAIASPDAHTHLRALQELAELLGDPATRRVFEHGDTTEILAVIRHTNTIAEGS